MSNNPNDPFYSPNAPGPEEGEIPANDLGAIPPQETPLSDEDFVEPELIEPELVDEPVLPGVKTPPATSPFPPMPSPANPQPGVAPIAQASFPASSAAGATGPSVPPRGDGAVLTPHGAASETPAKQLFDRVLAETRKIFIGQNELVLGTLVALFSSGHVLIESVPGLGKTLFVRTLGKVLGCDFGRIQFTPDLMPSDITGAPLFDMKTQEFRFRPGPVFTQFLLADEINRAPAKTHSALLEIMQEYCVTVDGVRHTLQKPFLVMATQNPIESEGTYNLPEAQLDRFMFKLVIDYPTQEQEMNILLTHSLQIDLDHRLDELNAVTTPEEIVRTTKATNDVRVDPRLVDYVNKVVRATRDWPDLHMGASPRAGITLMQGARTLASFRGRDYAVPDDVVQLVLPALRHRVILSAEAEVEGRNVDETLSEILRSVEVPRL